MTSINQKLPNNVEWICIIDDGIKVFDGIKHGPMNFFSKIEEFEQDSYLGFIFEYTHF